MGVDDDLNRASVPLASRFQGKQINEQANPEAKIKALSNMNSKAKDHASVGGEEFKAYAFDYWQYLDSMVFWEGLVPSADVIDRPTEMGFPFTEHSFTTGLVASGSALCRNLERR